MTNTPRQCGNCAIARPDGHDPTGNRADIRDEGEQTRRQPDDQAQIEACDGQRRRVIQSQKQAAQRLATHPGRQHAVNLTHLRPDDGPIPERQPGIHHPHDAGPVPQQVEAGHRRHDRQRQQVEDGKAAADQAGRGRQQDAQHGGRLAADQIADLVVHHLRPELHLQVGQHLLRPALEEGGVLRDAVHQQANLHDHQRIQQQREDQHRRQQGEDHHDRCQPARQSEAVQPRGGRIERVCNHPRCDEWGQYGPEQLQGEPEGNQEADDQGEALGPGGVRRHGGTGGGAITRRAGCSSDGGWPAAGGLGLPAGVGHRPVTNRAWGLTRRSRDAAIPIRWRHPPLHALSSKHTPIRRRKSSR